MDLSQNNIDSLEQMLSVGLEFNEVVDIIDSVRGHGIVGVIRCKAICRLSGEGLRIARELAEEKRIRDGY